MGYSDKLNVFATAAVFLIIIFGTAGYSWAQLPVLTGNPNEPSAVFGEALERRMREASLHSLKVEGREVKTDQHVSSVVLNQLYDDFKQLQIIRLGMVAKIKEGKPFENKRLAKDAEQIRKRADRLRTYLTVPEEQGQDIKPIETKELDKDQLQEAAFNLCLEISRFVENPIFKSAGSYRAADAAEAARTLLQVITLSEEIKLNAEHYRKLD